MFFLKKGQLSFHDCVYVSVYLSCLFTVGLKFHVLLPVLLNEELKGHSWACVQVLFLESVCVSWSIFLLLSECGEVNEGDSSVHHATGTARH